MSTTDCPVCETSGAPLLDDLTDFHVTKRPGFEVQYCKSCESGFSAPVMSEEDLLPYYPKEYEAYVPKRGFLARLQTLKYQMDLKLIMKSAPQGTSIFEIGAGRGEFLAEAKKQGFQVSGLEPSPEASSFARDHYGVSIETGYASSMRTGQNYDVVVARHVLEHVNDPQDLVKKIFKSLKSGGILFLKFPNFGSWERKLFGKFWSGWDLPRHRFHFSKQGIRQLLERNGYIDISVREEIVPASIVLSIKHLREGSTHVLIRGIAGLFLLLPGPVVTLLAQAWAVVMAPFESGRMIVVGRKA